MGDGTPGPGRPKGSQNKTTTALKEMILAALEEQTGGGLGYLKAQAVANPTAFLTLIGKVLPMTVVGDADAPVEVRITRRIIDAGTGPRDA